MIFKTVEEAQPWLEFWQASLQLRDWDVKLKIVRQVDMNGAQARVAPNFQHRCAIISLLDPRDFDEASPWEVDHEEDLVHECLHLHTMPMCESVTGYPEMKSFLPEEQCINALAKSFVAMRRAR